MARMTRIKEEDSPLTDSRIHPRNPRNLSRRSFGVGGSAVKKTSANDAGKGVRMSPEMPHRYRGNGLEPVPVLATEVGEKWWT